MEEENKQEVKPPWIHMPGVSKYDIGWRMGSGEDYIIKFWKYYDGLSKTEQKEYRKKYKARKEWRGYYNVSGKNL